MDGERYHYIDHELLRLTLHDSSDAQGFPTSLPMLWSAFRRWLPDITDREIVDSLKRLQPQYIALWKWSNETHRDVEFAEIGNDEEFFYRRDFRLRRTPHTDRHLQELAALLPPQEAVLLPAVTDIISDPEK
jgi:hypothetical protein